MIVEIPSEGARVEFRLSAGTKQGQVVVVIPEGVEISSPPQAEKGAQPRDSHRPTSAIREWRSRNGFPSRELTKQAITQILREHGGQAKIRDESSGWNIYDEIAARLGVSIEARRRLTAGRGESAWRPEVGFARRTLEQNGVIEPTQTSFRGVWRLQQGFVASHNRSGGWLQHLAEDLLS
jgi:hypothetical protein